MTERVIKVYKAHSYLINADKLETDEIAMADRMYTMWFYDEKKCNTCELLDDRHTETCDNCKAFKGAVKLSKVEEQKGKSFLSLPMGDKKTIRKFLRRLGGTFKVVDKHPNAAPFKRPIKFIGKLREYQEEASDTCIEKERGVIESPPRSGKCIVGSSLVMSQEGLVQIRDLFSSYELSPNSETIIETKETSIATVKGEREVSFLYTKVVDQTVRITTEQGYTVRGTPNHKVLVLEPGLNFKWVALSQVKAGQFLVVSRRPQWFGSGNKLEEYSGTLPYHQVPSSMSRELARLLGYWIANGSLSINGRLGITSNNEKVRKDFIHCLEKVFPGIRHREFLSETKASGVKVNSIHGMSFLKEVCDLTCNKAAGKKIPGVLLRRDRQFLLEFLGAYTTCDAWIHEHGVQYCSASKRLMRELHTVLTYLGIVGKFGSRWGSARNGTGIIRRYHYVSLHKNEADKLLALIQVRKFSNLSTKEYIHQHDVIPFGKDFLKKVQEDNSTPNKFHWVKNGKIYSKHQVGGLLYTNKKGLAKGGFISREYIRNVNLEVLKWVDPEACQKFLEAHNPDFYFSKIVSVTSIDKPVRVYDVSVPEGEHFVANGVVNHNTVIGSHVICRVGKKALILAHQREWLLNFQETFVGSGTQDRLTDAKKSQVQFCSKYEDFEKADVCLATFQQFMNPSGRKLLKKIQGLFEILVVDECHQGAATETARVLRCFNARYRIGLSGTPDRKDMRYPIASSLIGPVIYRAQVDRLRPRIRTIYTNVHVEMPKRMGQAGFSVFVNKLEGNKTRRSLIIKEAISLARDGHLVLIPLYRVPYIQALTKLINDEAEEEIARSFYGQTKDRKKLIEDARNYKFKIIVGNISLLSTGVNIPRASAIIEATATSNLPKCQQRISRILTPWEGKPDPIVVLMCDESEAMRSMRRNEFWNCIKPGFNPVIDATTYKNLVEWFSDKKAIGVPTLKDVFG